MIATPEPPPSGTLLGSHDPPVGLPNPAPYEPPPLEGDRIRLTGPEAAMRALGPKRLQALGDMLRGNRQQRRAAEREFAKHGIRIAYGPEVRTGVRTAAVTSPPIVRVDARSVAFASAPDPE